MFHYYQYKSDEGRPAESDETTSGGRMIDPRTVLSLLLEPRSLVITTASLYKDHLHGIDAIAADVFQPTNDCSSTDTISDEGPVRISNWSLLGDEKIKEVVKSGGVLRRGTRISLTCRDVERFISTQKVM